MRWSLAVVLSAVVGVSGVVSAPPVCPPLPGTLSYIYNGGLELKSIRYGKAEFAKQLGNGSPLIVGDILLEVNGKQVTNSDQLRIALASVKAKEPLRLVVLDARTGQAFLTDIDLRDSNLIFEYQPKVMIARFPYLFLKRPIS